MGAQGRARGSDTRTRIENVALELFAEQGYEKTSLREIADRLQVTKAALYYHFKTKEDILAGIADDLGRPVEELIEWGRAQPRTQETKREILRRYGVAIMDAAPLFVFIQENQPAMRELRIGERFKERAEALFELLREEGSSLEDRVRSHMALITMHAGLFALKDSEVNPEEAREAAQKVAFELLDSTEAAARA